MRKNCFSSITIIFVLISILTPILSSAQKEDTPIAKLIVFYSPGCQRCAEIENEVMPQIKSKFRGKILLEYRDISDIENYKLLLSLQEKYNAEEIKNVFPVFYFEGRFLNAEGNVKERLEALITESTGIGKKEKADLPFVDLISHFKNLRPVTIISAGLIDGINPCAFTVMIFFISFLTVQGYKRKDLNLIGLSFIFAVFLTYILIGIGIFGFLYRLEGFWLVAKIFNVSVGILSIILGFLALYDFFKFKKTGATEGLTLQLPRIIKNQIHSIIGLHYRKSKEPQKQQRIFRLIFSALITGFLVSILEAVCTGQVYLPTIAFVLKTTPLKLQALSYLLTYNLMFILPLLIIFLFALWGTTSQAFARFLQKHLLTIKILMAILFFSLGVFLVWRA